MLKNEGQELGGRKSSMSQTARATASADQRELMQDQITE
jgi:hypothetical protein